MTGVADNPPMPLPPQPPRFLAIETSTDTLSLALGTGQPGDPVWAHSGPGAAQASATLLPAVQHLLTEAGWALADLSAIAFARGPGSFTGLRTACAVAQGLAYGIRTDAHPEGLPVLPVDTLLVLAEEARHAHEADNLPAPRTLVPLLDARMNEIYLAAYALRPSGLEAVAPARLCAPEALADWLAQPPVQADDHTLLAGNAFTPYAERLAHAPGQRRTALPTATALLRLAPALFAQGAAVPASQAMPLYVRDKVAQTTAEREQRAQGATP